MGRSSYALAQALMRDSTHEHNERNPKGVLKFMLDREESTAQFLDVISS